MLALGFVPQPNLHKFDIELVLPTYQLRIRTDYPQFEPFQIWHFKSISANQVGIACLDGYSQTPFIQDEVEVLQSTFPEITLWLVNSLLLLPSEYCGVQTLSQIGA